MSSLTRDGTAEPVSRDQILRRERGQGNNIDFPCSANHEQQDWQPYPVDPDSCYIPSIYICMCGHAVVHPQYYYQISAWSPPPPKHFIPLYFTSRALLTILPNFYALTAIILLSMCRSTPPMTTSRIPSSTPIRS